MSNEDWHDDEDVEALINAGELLISRIISGESLSTLKGDVEDGAPLWYQDAEGKSALHAAAYNEDPELVAYLIEKGAVWNAADNLGNTAGDIALSFNNEQCYNLIRDAGIRSELLLTILSGREDNLPIDEPEGNMILRVEDATAAGSLSTFLHSKLKFTKDIRGQEICVVQAGEDEVGVMMGWEREITQETAIKLCINHPNYQTGLQILNVGFGLGIIDSAFQSFSSVPAKHVIIEAHPDVLQHMRELGWYEKPGVIILEGTWQDVMSTDSFKALGQFDIVYTDTFSESYGDLYRFFKLVPSVLGDTSARFGFFNGLGATNALVHDVYTQLAGAHLERLGMNVEWTDIDIIKDNHMGDRWGDTRSYFSARYYRMPIACMKSK